VRGLRSLFWRTPQEPGFQFHTWPLQRDRRLFATRFEAEGVVFEWRVRSTVGAPESISQSLRELRLFRPV
jgi:hypothetical protein